MDTQPILDRIREDAREAAQKLLREAEDRVMTIHEQADLRVAGMRRDTEDKAREESVQQAERMRRLAQLEDRKDRLAAMRGMVDEAFVMALSRLHALDDAEAAAYFISLIAQNAVGDETVTPGEIGAGFYGQVFLEKANAALRAAGKPAGLTDAGGRVPGVRGVVLKSASGELHCTFESALESRREAMEASVAGILFPDAGH